VRRTFVGPDTSVLGNGGIMSNSTRRTLFFDAQSRLQSIPACGFFDCHNHRSAKVPKRVRVIGERFFESCSELAEVSFDFPSTIRKIESSAFSGCSGLSSFTVPSSVSILGIQLSPGVLDCQL
jgi:hypothetical protein